jgi:hypothetical protein
MKYTNGKSAVHKAAAVPVAKATKQTAEHHWAMGNAKVHVGERNQHIKSEKVHKFDGSKNVATNIDGATKEGWGSEL